MKTTIVSIILCILISSTVFAQLTDQDLEKIRGIVQESEERLNKRIDEVREEVKAVEGRLNTRIDSVEKNINTRISDLRTTVIWMVGILASILIAALVLPQFLGRSKKDAEELEEVRGIRDEVREIYIKSTEPRNIIAHGVPTTSLVFDSLEDIVDLKRKLEILNSKIKAIESKGK